MIYVKLPSKLRQISEWIFRLHTGISETVRRAYPDSKKDAERAVLIMSICTGATLPSIGIATFYGMAGVPAGALLFGGMAVMWGFWYVLLTRFPGLLRITSHLYILFVALTFHLPIAMSNGLHSPAFAMQIITPLTAIMILNWKEFLVWVVVCLLALMAWYYADLPVSDVLIVGNEQNLRVVASLVIFFATMRASEMLLANRELIFQNKETMETEMKLSQAVIGGIVSGQMEERKRLLEELLEECGPRLKRIKLLQNEMLSQAGFPTGEKQGFRDRLVQLEVEIGRIAQVLPASGSKEIGLKAALANLCSHLENAAGVHIDISIPVGPEIPLDTRNIHIYRILQEAFHNVVRHARAGRVQLALHIESGQVTGIKVEDDGIGLDTRSKRRDPLHPTGQGLQNIRDRVALLNGQLSIQSPPGKGTQIRISLPRDGQHSPKLSRR